MIHPPRALAHVAQRLFGPASLAVAGLVGAGCAGDISPPSELAGVRVTLPDDVALLAEATLPDEGHIAFYEPEPGALLIIESGRADAPRAYEGSEGRLRADALYEKLTGAAAPAALRDAVQRQAVAEPARERGAVAEGDDEVPAPEGQVTQALGVSRDAASFRSRHCEDIGGTNLIWLNRTGDGSVGQKNDKNWVAAAVRAHRGTVRFVFKVRPWYTWRDQAEVSIPAGYYESVEVWNNVDFDIKGSVSEADGDVYDFCTSHGTGTIWLPA